MTQDTKWEIRQIALTYFSLILSPTAWLLYYALIKAWKFADYAHGTYFKEITQHGWTIEGCINNWWIFEVKGLLLWLPLTLAIDVFLRRYLIRFD